jgi:hypothetical protein
VGIALDDCLGQRRVRVLGRFVDKIGATSIEGGNMKNTALALVVVTMARVTALAPPQEVGLSREQLVSAMRYLNTCEYTYFHDNKRFASAREFLSWLERTGKTNQAPLSFSAESLKPYELRVTTTSDGSHYQVSMTPISDMNDRSTWCKPAAFSDDGGVIFLGLAIGCEAPGKASTN